jgi:hypothetical protein
MTHYPLHYRIFLGVALLHLMLMACGASYVGYSWLGPFAPALEYYGQLSGAGNSYGFFAPEVAGQLRASFEVIDRSGRNRFVPLETGTSHEADLRTGNIIDQFSQDFQDSEGDHQAEDLQRSLSSSLAGTVFGRYPDAFQVVVHLEKFTPISMADYRKGEKPQWTPVYQAKFALNRDLKRGTERK